MPFYKTFLFCKMIDNSCKFMSVDNLFAKVLFLYHIYRDMSTAQNNATFSYSIKICTLKGYF